MNNNNISFHSVLQVAAVIGIGLVYQGTGHRHNAEVLLSEIGEYIFIYINTNIYIKIYLHKYIYIFFFFLP